MSHHSRATDPYMPYTANLQLSALLKTAVVIRVTNLPTSLFSLYKSVFFCFVLILYHVFLICLSLSGHVKTTGVNIIAFFLFVIQADGMDIEEQEEQWDIKEP